jgi:hypothetical protein
VAGICAAAALQSNASGGSNYIYSYIEWEM